MDPMVSFLTGWLAACLGNTGAQVMRIDKVEIKPPDTLHVHFASGLVLEVRVSELPRGR